MPREEEKNEDKVNPVKINNHAASSIAEFTKRPLPSEKEIEDFEDYIQEEAREEEIEESLNEIYHDDKGQAVDVGRLDIKKRHGVIFWLASLLFFLCVTSAAGYGAYYYYWQSGTDARAIELAIDGAAEVAAGEEFFYTVTFRNRAGVDAVNLRLELSYPENFVFLDADPPPQEKDNIWRLAHLGINETRIMKIRGKIIGVRGETGIILGHLSYTPANFSSEFEKNTSLTTKVADIGLSLEAEYLANVLVGEENEIVLKYAQAENNFINTFRFTVEPAENLKFLKIKETELPSGAKEIRPGVWDIAEVVVEERTLPIKFAFTGKKSESQEVKIYAEEEGVNGGFYKFYEQAIPFLVMKNDLNLTLIINGSRDDQGVNFGDTLNYSLVYNNKGEADLKDVIIMAVLESNYLDWTTLATAKTGREKGNMITWTKNEIAELAVVSRDQEGTIDFSIRVKDEGDFNPAGAYEIKSYAQFSLGNKEELPESAETRSNTIVNRINSDLRLEETVRYFSDDNVAVGTGPLPPRAGETTSYKIYWSIKNNLHELNDTKVVLLLPDYIFWTGKERASVGRIAYEESARTVVWDIGRLPITAAETGAEFSLSLTPAEADRDKILVTAPGSTVTAIDSETGAEISDTTKAKTTKFEDDPIGGNDGMVQ